ncbi:biliverdin-producing heme oxygenase [Ramlibacter sp. AN1015]|uniref:biliverdin-producing heme oxygenase n=1 Tax=Ramlibacter sp. AN1015 TaxID=3133428 RepID=UPI0030BD8BF8
MRSHDQPGVPLAATRHLKQATAVLHADIESLLRLDLLTTLPRVCGVLQVFDAFLADWEPRVSTALPPSMQPWFEAHRRGAWARDDLQVLGAARCAPAASPEIELDSPAAALGSLYVLEGSALGGQVIARTLRDHLQLTETTGARYFAGRGARTGPLWRAFCEQFEAQVQQPAEVEAACRGARQTFGALIRQFRARADALA